MVSSTRCADTIHCLEKERQSGTKQHKCHQSADHSDNNNDKYSCVVKKLYGFSEKEISLVVESEFLLLQ